MHPTLVREPFHRPGWVYQEKIDGYRMLAYRMATASGSWVARALTTPSGSATSRRRFHCFAALNLRVAR